MDRVKGIYRHPGRGGQSPQKGETMRFEDYGVIEWVEPEAFYAEGWSVVGRATGEDGEEYDILLSVDKTTYGYSNI